MNDTITTLPPPPELATPHPSRHVLSAPGLEASLVTLAPTERIAGGDERAAHAHMLFVVQGSVAIDRVGLTHLLKKGDALHLAAGTVFMVKGDAEVWTQLLWLTLAPRENPAPALFMFPPEQG